MTILAWANLGACLLLVLVCVALYFDARGARKAHGAVVAALQRQTAAHDAAIGNLSRAVALLVPPDTRPTAPHCSALVVAGNPPQLPPLSRGATAARIEALALPSVDTEGDRPGINAGDPIPRDAAAESGARSVNDGPTSAEIRARFEVEEDARHPDDEPPEERTHVYSPPRPPRRPTLVGGLAGVEPERPTSSAARTREAFERSHRGAQSTLISAGTVQLADDRPAAPTTPPGGPANEVTPTEPGDRLDPAVARRWGQKMEHARRMGLAVEHCGSMACKGGAHGLSACACLCSGCARRDALLAEAAREVLGGR